MTSSLVTRVAVLATLLVFASQAQGQDFTASAAAGAPTTMQHTAVQHATGMYVFGGYDGSPSFPGNVYRYTTAGGWQTRAAIPNSGLPPFGERRDHTAVVYVNDMYVFGGFNFNDGAKNTVWRYNILADSWHGPFTGAPTYTTSGTPPSARYAHGAAIIGSNMYVFGGSTTSSDALNDLYVLNVASGAWSTVTPTINGGTFNNRRDMAMAAMPQARCGTCATDCFYLHGGYNPIGTTHYNDIWRYCPGTNTFDEITPVGTLPVRRSQHAAMVQNGRFVISGGYNDLFPNDYLNDYWEYDPIVNGWHEVTFTSSYPARREHTLVPIDATTAVAFGGTTRLVIQDTLYTTPYQPLLCSAGTFNSLGYGNCTQCNPGESAVAGSYNCTQCADGTYAEFPGSGTCTPCAAGYFGDGVGGTSIAFCLPCPAGTGSGLSAAPDNSTCSPCPLGHNSTAGSSGCTPCPNGQYQDETGQEFCKLCRPGNRCPAIATAETPCSPGTHQPQFGQITCLACGAGQYSVSGQANCTDCGLGNFVATAGTSAAACDPCPQGTFGNETALGVCYDCPSGTWSSSTQATSDATCTPCGTGTYNPTAGQTNIGACQDCPPGTWNGVQGQSICTNCAAGTYSAATGQTAIGTCTNCPAGTENPTPGGPSLASCTDCLAGTWSDGVGATPACTQCTAGTYNPLTAQTSVASCITCPASTTSSDGAAICGACAAGQFALPGSTYCELCRTNTTAGYEFDSFIADRHMNNLATSGVWNTLGGGYTVDLVNGNTNSGSNAATPTCAAINAPPAGSTFGIRQNVNIGQTAPASIMYGAWSRAVNLTGTIPNNAWHLRAQVVFSDFSIENFQQNFQPANSGEWTFASGYIVSTKTIVSINLRARFGGSDLDASTGAVYFDDFILSNASAIVCGCDPGYYQVSDRVGECEYCPAGYLCDVGSITACPTGQFSFGGSQSCEVCRPGWVCTSGIGLPCLPDTYHDGGGNCLPCPQDSMCAQGVRQQCGAGTYGIGTHKCEPCIPGTYNNMTGATQCQNCTRGWTSGHKADHCHVCPEGESSVEGSGVCYSCPEGTYNDVPGTSECKGCPVDHYCDLEGTINPYPCPAGTSTSGAVNRTNANDCV